MNERIVKRLICFDAASIAWLKQQENASLAIRKLIHAELVRFHAGRPRVENGISGNGEGMHGL